MVESPDYVKPFLKKKRQEALDLGPSGAVVGALVAVLVAAANGQLSMVPGTLAGCAAFFAASFLAAFANKQLDAGAA